jgi:phage-related protein (TIGR01555 family)
VSLFRPHVSPPLVLIPKLAATPGLPPGMFNWTGDAPRSLQALGTVPNYLSGVRNDSMLDGLIGTGPRDSAHGGWVNPLTGHGTNRDKVTAGEYREQDRITDPELSALWNGNDLAKRIVGAKAKEMYRRGWVLNFPGAPGPDDPKTALAAAAAAPKPSPAAKALPPNDPESKVRTDDLSGNQNELGPPGPTAVAIAEPPKPDEVPATDGKPGDQGDKADIAKAMELYAKPLDIRGKFLNASIFGGLYGGGLLIMGLDDGQDVSMPLNEDNIRGVSYLTWIDRRFIVAHTWYDEIGPSYGEVEIWNIINPFGNQRNTLIHESRVLRFDGEPVDLFMRRRLAGWTLSRLQAPYDVMRQFDMSFQSVASLMSDISQAVMSVNGLAQMISNDQKTLQTRMQMIDMARSSMRMVFIDAENEKFERVATPLTGVSDVMQMQMLRMAAAADTPVAILFGREPSGLNATGDADFRRWYDCIAGDQTNEVEPKLERLYTLLCRAKDSPAKGVVPSGGLSFTWHKLYAPSELEQSTIRFNMAQADDLYIGNGTLLPEEVAMSRFRSGDLHLDTEIQGDLRRESLKTAQLAPSGADKFQADQDQKTAELKIKSDAVTAKGPPAPAKK